MSAKGITRRAAVGAVAWPLLHRHAQAQAQPEATPPERAAMAAAAHGFMQKYDAPGLGVAIARQGRLVYDESFGFAERETHEALRPAHRFRIASVTKPVTSVAICILIQQGLLRFQDKVFGPNGALGTDFGAPPYEPHVADITIEHLLTHTCGGWTNDGNDPMFQRPELEHAELIAWAIRTHPLQNPPGKAYAYSNFGYCVLGRVIEKIGRRPYAEFVREVVLRRCGIADMEIAGNTLAERKPLETRYYGQGGENPYDMNVARMDSHGGWIARPADLVAFATHVDGFSTTPSLLNPDTIRMMTTASAVNRNYAKGWAVNQAGNWWHNGSLPGTTTIMVRTHSQFCWAALTNTRAAKGDIGGDLDQLVWAMVGKVAGWNA
ncbi:MAG: serine hydrolase domain-containing protein [Hyphomicrobiales bacterium]